MVFIAVPWSLTDGDNARDAISASTIKPKRGSASKDLASPIVNASTISSDTTFLFEYAMARSGETNSPGNHEPPYQNQKCVTAQHIAMDPPNAH